MGGDKDKYKSQDSRTKHKKQTKIDTYGQPEERENTLKHANVPMM